MPLKKTKSKPKLKNVDYFDMVSKIVRSSDDGSSNKKANTHDFIFDAEKTKEEKREGNLIKRNQSNIKLSNQYGWMYKFLVKQS